MSPQRQRGGCRVSLLVSEGVMGFLGDLRGKRSKSPPNPLGSAERVPRIAHRQCFTLRVFQYISPDTIPSTCPRSAATHTAPHPARIAASRLRILQPARAPPPAPDVAARHGIADLALRELAVKPLPLRIQHGHARLSPPDRPCRTSPPRTARAARRNPHRTPSSRPCPICAPDSDRLPRIAAQNFSSSGPSPHATTAKPAACAAFSASSGRFPPFIRPAKPTRTGVCAAVRGTPSSHAGSMPLGMTCSLSASASRAAPENQPSTFSRAAPPRQTTRAAPRRIRRAIGRRCGSYFQIRRDRCIAA